MLLATITLAMFLAPVQEGALRFDAAQVVLAADDPLVKRVLNIDADGIPDAIGIQIDYGYGSAPHKTFVGVYYGDGTGGLNELHTLTITGPFPSLENPMVAGDFDGDGDDDFALTVSNELHVFLCDGRNEPQAQPPISLAGQTVVDLEVGDVNGDGRDDLVAVARVSNTEAYANVFLSPTTWTGGWASFTLLPSPPTAMALFRVGSELRAAVSYATGAPQYEVYVLELLLAGGVPVLGTSHLLPTPPFTGIAPELGGGDVDGDGDDDVVAFGESTYYCLRSNGAALLVESGQPGGPATDLFDIDQDGDLDGVCCGGGGDSPPSIHTWASTWEIALNDGSGGFAPAIQLSGVGGKRWAGAADVDNDGDLDLIAGRTVYFDQGDHYAVSLPGLRPALSTGGLVDGDGDGDLDVNVALQNGILPTYWRNDGSGSYSFETHPTTGWPTTWNAPYTAGVGDYDGDNDPDTVIGLYLAPGVPQSYFVENVAGTYTYSQTPTSSTLPALGPNRKALSFDWDRDGDVDILHTPLFVTNFSGVYPTKFFLNDGAGNFTQISDHSKTWILERADFDGDDVLDFLIATQSGLGWRRGLPTGGYGAFQALPVVLYPDSAVAVADLDEDGDLDIATVENNGVVPVFFENQGSGTFVARYDVIPQVTVASNSIDVGFVATDFDLDGRVDLVMTPGPSGWDAARLYRNSAAGSLSFEFELEQVFHGVPSAYDIDGDGDEDLVAGVAHRNRANSATMGGSWTQHGLATAGSGGFEPTLGVGSLVDVGKWARLHTAGVKGGQLSILAFGLVPAVLPDFPVLGVTAYLDPSAATTIYFPMPGAPVDGEGRLFLPFFVPPVAGGLTFHHQLFVYDPSAPGGMAASRALSVTYGMP